MPGKYIYISYISHVLKFFFSYDKNNLKHTKFGCIWFFIFKKPVKIPVENRGGGGGMTKPVVLPVEFKGGRGSRAIYPEGKFKKKMVFLYGP